MRRTIGAGLAIGALALVLGACNSAAGTTATTTAKRLVVTTSTTTPAPTTTTTTTAPSVAPKVLAILTSYNTQASALANTSNWSGLTALFNSSAQQLGALTYPANAQADAKALIHDLNTLAADSAEQNVSALQTDIATGHADSDALRSDLGLPAAPTGA